MRVLGLPIIAPDVVVGRALSDLSALARAARRAPEQLDRLLRVGEEMVAIGHGVLELGERIDRRADLILSLGERIDVQVFTPGHPGGRPLTIHDNTAGRSYSFADRAGAGNRIVDVGQDAGDSIADDGIQGVVRQREVATAGGAA